MSSSSIVYTAVMGGYEELNEQPLRQRSDLRFVCFTDSSELTSETWEIHRVEPILPADPVRSARHLKIVGHPLLEDADQTLWVDNSVLLRELPERILQDWLSEDHDLAVPQHGFRARLIDEFDAVVQAGYDEPGRVYEQLRHYLDLWPELLDDPPLFTALLARRRTTATGALGQHWYTDVLRYSRRDQLSVLPSLARTAGLRWRRIEMDSWSSPVHQWPVAGPRVRGGPFRSHTEATAPIALQLRRLTRQVDEQGSELAHSSMCLHAAKEQAEALLAVVRHREARLTQVEEEAAHWRAVAQDARGRLEEMERSTSWRVGRIAVRAGSPLRRLAGRGGRPTDVAP